MLTILLRLVVNQWVIPFMSLYDISIQPKLNVALTQQTRGTCQNETQKAQATKSNKYQCSISLFLRGRWHGEVMVFRSTKSKKEEFLREVRAFHYTL